MNTPVSPELDKLLLSKNIDMPVNPTIADVVMWFYEKHGIWILPLPTLTGYFAYKIIDIQLNPEKPIERPPYLDVSTLDYNTPWKAYEAAFIHLLNNVI